MSYDFPFSEMPVDPEFGVGFAFVGIYLLVMLFAMVFSLVIYIFQSLGLYSIAKRRGIHHPWLAWIPFGIVWILGSISDQYQYVAKGKVKSRRKTLLGLAIATSVLGFAFFAGIVTVIVAGVIGQSESAMLVPGIIGLVAYLAMFVVAIVSMVLQHICMYNLYESCDPNNAVAFLVLGILVNILPPIFIFAVRKKDLGMPPRRVQIPVAPWQPAEPAPQSAWQNPAPAEEPVNEETEE